MPVAEALASVRQAVKAAGVNGIDMRLVCAAVAGYSHKVKRQEFTVALRLLFPKADVTVVPDYEAAFQSALPTGYGVVVIAGTGSIAYAQGRDNRAARAGGYGYLIDDAGSGYGVGRQALAAILAAQEGLGETTSLQELVANQFGWPIGKMTRDKVVQEVYFGDMDRVKIASLAQTVAEAAADGDGIAHRILMQAGGALARLADAACRLALIDKADVILVARIGGLWQAGAPLTDVFERSLSRFAPRSVYSQPTVYTPAWGAAQIAKRLMDNTNT